MADKEKLKPVNIEQPVDIKVTSGKIDTSSAQNALNKAQQELEAARKAWEAKVSSANINVDYKAAEQAREEKERTKLQAISGAIIGRSGGFDISKYAKQGITSTPNILTPAEQLKLYTPEKIKSIKGIRDTTVGQLDKNLTVVENEIKDILNSLKMPLEAGASAPSKSVQSRVKSMNTIFNKLLAKTAKATDVRKFIKYMDELPGLYGADIPGGMTPKATAGRLAQLEALRPRIKEVSERVAKEETSPLITGGIDFTKKAKAVVYPKAETTGENALIMARQAVADAARDEALGIAKKTKVSNKFKGRLGASFGGTGKNVAKKFDLGVAALPGIEDGLENLFVGIIKDNFIDPLTKVGVRALSTAVYRQGTVKDKPHIGVDLNKQIALYGTGGRFGGGGKIPGGPGGTSAPLWDDDEFKSRKEGAAKTLKSLFSGTLFKDLGAKAGEDFIESMATKLAKGAASAGVITAGALVVALGAAILGGIASISLKITEAILKPLATGIVTGIKEAGNTIRTISIASYPLMARGESYEGATQKVNKALAEQVGHTTETLDITGKIAQRFIKLAGTTEGVSNYVKAITNYTIRTGESAKSIDDTFLEIAQFLGVDITKSGALLVDHMTQTMNVTQATSDELRTIAQWIMPVFAMGAGTAEEKMKGVLDAAAKLAQTGNKAPRSLAQITTGIDKILNPSITTVGLNALIGAKGNFWTEGPEDAKREWKTTYDDLTSRWLSLHKRITGIRTGGYSPQLSKELTSPLERQQAEIGEQFVSSLEKALSKGLSPASASTILKTLGEAIKNADFALEFTHALGGGQIAQVKKALIDLGAPLPTLSESIKDIFKEPSKDLGVLKKQATEASSTLFRFMGVLISGPAETSFFTKLVGQFKKLGEEYIAFNNLSAEKKGGVGGLFGGLFVLGQNLKNVVDKYIGPAVTDYVKYLQLILGGGNTQEIENLGKNITGNMEQGVKELTKILVPILEPVAEVFANTLVGVFKTVLTSIQSNQEIMNAIGSLGKVLGRAIGEAIIVTLKSVVSGGFNYSNFVKDIETKRTRNFNTSINATANQQLLEVGLPPAGAPMDIMDANPQIIQLRQAMQVYQDGINSITELFGESNEAIAGSLSHFKLQKERIDKEIARIKESGKSQ